MSSQEHKNLFMRGALLYAKKPTASAHDWKIRYYILRDLEGNLVGCDVHENELPSTPVGILQLFHAKVKESEPISGGSIYPFSVEPASGKAWHLAAKSEQDRVAWKSALEEAIKLAPSETETERNKHIEKLILQEKKAMSKAPELKMLLLGPGQSGKSTVLKQMKILHCNGFTPSEHEFYRGLCRSNVLDIMKQLLDACESLGLKLGSESKAHANTFLKYFSEVTSKTNEENGVYVSSEEVGGDEEDEEPDLKKIGKSPRGISGNTSYGALASINGATSPRGPQLGAKSIEIPASIVHSIKSLWKDNIIRHEVLAHAPEYHIPDSTVYFLDDVDRITASDYKPSSQDILRSRHRTSGVHETIFLIDDTKFRIIDVGGQRGERKKWISFFEDVTAVVYVAAISEYDQKLKEDQTTNRLHEALIVFENVCKMKIFANVPIILFLNKDDIFREKIKKVPLSVCFKKYDGENSYQPARNYIQKKFERRRGFKERIIYTHVICATDTESFKKVSQATQDIILTKALHDAHL